MDEETLLLNPGPVPLAPGVQSAMDRPLVSHRSADFEDIYANVRDGLETVYTHSRRDGQTAAWDGEVVVFNATATMGMEAAIANFTDDQSRVLATINGNFGRRFANIAERQCQLEEYQIPWGESFDVDALAEEIESGEYDIVTAVHTETSTGLRNPLGAIGEAVAATDALFVVDGVSSIGGEYFHPAEWGVDIAVVDAQKAIAASPGISAMFLSEDALSALSAEQEHFYADVHRHVEKAAENQTPYTSAVTLFYGMQAALETIHDRGVDAWLEGHAQRSKAWMDAANALGLSLFASPAGPSDYANTVVAIELPERVREDPTPFFETLQDRNVFVGGGHGHLDGRIFRLGTMGGLSAGDMDRGIRAIGAGLSAAGYDADVDGARDAIASILDG